jgi:serine/threonine protein kinase
MDMDLSDYLEEISDKKISINTAKKIMRQVTESIKCMHEIGIIYNDLKPDNILINKNHTSKLTDFNCILKLEEEGQPEYDKKYTGCSTGSYRSPEQVNTAVSYDTKADSWQLGILFMCILQKNSRSFISNLSRKFGYERDDIIENLPLKILKKQLEICKDKFIELKNEKEFNNMTKLIIGLLEHNPEERWDIQEILNSDFLNTKKKTIKKKKMVNKHYSKSSSKKLKIRDSSKVIIEKHKKGLRTDGVPDS